MEKRSRRRIRDLVTLLAAQGLSENEIGCARISMMAKSMNALFTGRIQKRKTNPLHHSHLACNTRPVHTEGHSLSMRLVSASHDVRSAPKSRHYVQAQNMRQGGQTETKCIAAEGLFD
jgi:hypothetical protein